MGKTTNKPDTTTPIDGEFQLIPFEFGELNEVYSKKAERELNENPEIISQAIRLLKEKVKNDKLTSEYHFNDDYYLRFLRAKKYDVTRAFSNVKHACSFLKRYKNLFNEIRYENMVYAIESEAFRFLPWRCQDGCAVLWIQLDRWDPSLCPIDDVKRIVALFLLEALKDPLSQVNGFKVIFDVKSNPLKHLRFCTPENIWMMYHGTQVCIPGRYKQIHIVNQSLTFRAAWFLVKPFLNVKLKSRIFFHSDGSTLKKFFPEAILPVEYGGHQVKYDHREWLRKATSKENIDMLFARKPSVNES